MPRQPTRPPRSALHPLDGSALDGLPHTQLWTDGQDATAPLTFSVVDLETTGASAIYDRILEVAVVKVVGAEIVDRYTQLVDPRAPISAFITRLTGIDARMVRGKPTFPEIAADVQAALGEGPLVAHNASFDEAFLRHAYTRLGQKLTLPKLCTLRLARRLLPRLPSYRLDALTSYFGIKISNRHRALGDAEATALVLLRLLDLAAERGVERLDDLLALQGSPVGKRPRGVDESVIQALPSGNGVYILKDADGHVVYIGKSVHVRQRVREHLRGGSPDQPRLRRHLSRIVDVEGIPTGSELEALFLESRLIKRYLPEGNQQQRNDRDYPFIQVNTADPHPRLEYTRESPSDQGILLGPFRRRGAVASAVDLLTEQLGLRQCSEPLKEGMSACALLDLGKCLGPCVGAVDGVAYRAAVERALGALQGADETVLAELVARRDALAEDLRFEDAARLRDQIRAFEHVVNVQRRLQSVAARNLAIVAPSVESAAREVFWIRRGQLAGQARVTRQTRQVTVERALGMIYGDSAASAQLPIPREKVDEMHLLDTWLQRNDERLTVIQVDAADPASAAPAILAAVRQATTSASGTARRARAS
ncbi:MAG: GIY-YIG nuclease family protein [Chloroflexi bacterium]|nr:GIY-YIG nuclease family protein [Chloroflexota bacterium]